MYSRLNGEEGDYEIMDGPVKPAPPPPYNKLTNVSGYESPSSSAPQIMGPQPTVVSISNMGTEPSHQPVGPKPVILTCPQCRCRNKTKIRRRANAKTHLACLLLFWSMCCFVPYCIDSCNNLDHFCPTCEAFVGSYS
ncbi:lipopolysaccharide-induced tumor necrosis factor-alpha factor homolog [Stomoxys calcitrans]|uniref:LITAF domain-containing protein n=1 Tax=Stomoxys calcitrans TaxID=35570 RepID=A0A1I8PHK6_STOCA|nr:lipopolysaccharide-induced tumor necrosis factor-alpha factor homolog [Stomoxys calcitrans]